MNNMALPVSCFECELTNNLVTGSYNNILEHGLNAIPRYVSVTLADGTIMNSLPWKADPENPLKNVLLSWGTDSGVNVSIYILATLQQSASGLPHPLA